MSQGNSFTDWLAKHLGSAVLAGLVAIAALLWGIFSSYSDGQDSKRQLDNQAIQIAKQETQIALIVEQNQLQSQQLTVEAQIANLQGSTSLPENNPDYSLTATAFAAQEIQIEATKQAITDKQKELEATQTAVSQSFSTPVIVIRADDIIPQIKGEDGGIQKAINWWSEVDYSGDSGQLDPSSPISKQKCFGLAWNTNQYGYHRLIVFQKPTTVSFADGGWYIKVCIPDNIVISAEDVGRIQADWLGKRYGIDNTRWRVIVIE
jgi:hypothetical protein